MKRGRLRDWRRFFRKTASLRPRRLRIDGRDVVTLPDQFDKRRDREIRCAEKGKAQAQRRSPGVFEPLGLGEFPERDRALELREMIEK